jgi:hypothetical protein
MDVHRPSIEKDLPVMTDQTSKFNRLLLVVLATLPVYFYMFVDKVLGRRHDSVTDLLGWQLLVITMGLLWLWGIHKYILKNKFNDLSPDSGDLLLDISVGFLLLISVYLIETVARLTYYQWLPVPNGERTVLLQSLRTIAANPFYSIVWLGPVILLGQLFLELSRTIFLKNFWDYTDSSYNRVLVILFFAVLISLLSLDRGWSGITSGFFIALLFNITYFRYRRLFPLLLASILFQYLSLLGFWLE